MHIASRGRTAVAQELSELWEPVPDVVLDPAGSVPDEPERLEELPPAGAELPDVELEPELREPVVSGPPPSSQSSPPGKPDPDAVG